MRPLATLAATLLLASCSPGDERAETERARTAAAGPLTGGESRTRIVTPGTGAAMLRSGRAVPVMLPPGLTLYPGARIVANTVVEQGGVRRMLLIFETPAAVPEVRRFYRRQAQVAGASLNLDIGGAERASLGGSTAGGEPFVISARRVMDMTRAEFSAG